MMRTHGRMRERRHIYSPLIYAHVYRFSQSRVCIRFARFCKMSFHTQNALTPREKNFEKRHTSGKEKEPLLRSSFFCCRSVRFYMWYTHARTRLCLSFRYQRKGDHRVHPLVSRSIGACAFSFSSLGKSCKDYIIYSPRARPKKKSKTLSSARESDPSFFITTRFQKSGSLFGSMRERRGERLSSSFVVEEVRSIDRSIVCFARFSFLLTNSLSLYQQLWKTGTFWAFDHTLPWTTRASFYSKKEFLNKKSLKKEQNII